MSKNMSYQFSNWARSVQFRPGEYAQPLDQGEVVELVRQTEAAGRTLRVVGGGHSFSPLVQTAETLVNLDHIRQVVLVDHERRQVTVGAGIRLRELNELLPRYNLALQNVGSIAEQSVAGAISTGTHGTGLHIGNLATQIVGMTLVTGRGKTLELTQARDPEMMAAARVSLGALGVITQVTIQCVKQHNLEMCASLMPFEQALEQLDTLNATNQRVRMYWFSGTEQMYVMRFNPTVKPESQRGRVGAWYNDVLLRMYTQALMFWLGHRVPRLVEAINRFQVAVGLHAETRVARGDRALLVPMTPVHHQTEYAVPVERTAEAVRATRRLIEERRFKTNVPLELRFVAADANMLSPAYGHAVCHLGAYAYGEKFVTPYFAAFGQTMKKLGGRPHWGKWLELSAQEARALYPCYERFDEIRKELDPRGTFTNPYIRELFGDTRRTL